MDGNQIQTLLTLNNFFVKFLLCTQQNIKIIFFQKKIKPLCNKSVTNIPDNSFSPALKAFTALSTTNQS